MHDALVPSFGRIWPHTTKMQDNDYYIMKPFHGGGKTCHLICKNDLQNDRICLPEALQECAVHWYHTQLVQLCILE